MAHFEQQDFCKYVKRLHPEHFKNKYVLDTGSLDINGNNRDYFEDSFYIGVDVGPGKNVDLVSSIHELKFRNEFFDTIISTESLEHDPTYYLTLNNIYRMLKSGGLFLFTCASTGRPEHGTFRTDNGYANPLMMDIPIWANYYKNLTEDDIRFCLDINNCFTSYEFSTIHPGDIYFWGIKR